jgi:hypothetical protein
MEETTCDWKQWISIHPHFRRAGNQDRGVRQQIRLMAEARKQLLVDDSFDVFSSTAVSE